MVELKIALVHAVFCRSVQGLKYCHATALGWHRPHLEFYLREKWFYSGRLCVLHTKKALCDFLVTSWIRCLLSMEVPRPLVSSCSVSVEHRIMTIAVTTTNSSWWASTHWSLQSSEPAWLVAWGTTGWWSLLSQYQHMQNHPDRAGDGDNWHDDLSLQTCTKM